MSSIMVEEIGLEAQDPPLVPYNLPGGDYNGDFDASIAEDSTPAASLADVEMQLRMDEDAASRTSSRSHSGDCDMADTGPVAMDASCTVDVEPVGVLVEQCTVSASQEAVVLATEDHHIIMPHIVNDPTRHEADTHAATEAQLPQETTGPAAESFAIPQSTDRPPIDASSFADNPLIELSRQSWGVRQPNYLRNCLWSPDGSCLLTPVNRDGMHVVELPADLYADAATPLSAARPLDILTSAVHVPENGTVYDFCWYPFMHSAEPASCCWLSTQQHGPIQMWDAFDGKLRCSYRGYDNVDEVEAAVSVCFSCDGATVIGGYRKSVKIFRTAVPGRECTQFRLRTAASCLAVHERQPDLLAIGAWTGAVTVHDTRTAGLEVLERLARRRAGGVTQMRFTADGQRLWAGARKDGALACWDLRMPAEPVRLLRRTVRTNQRVQFDVSADGRWLVSGGTEGVVRVWDLEQHDTAVDDDNDDGGTEAEPLREWRFALHQDCCNGVALHPTRPVLATCSGQHHFGNVDDGEASANENSLIFWWYGKSVVDDEGGEGE